MSSTCTNQSGGEFKQPIVKQKGNQRKSSTGSSSALTNKTYHIQRLLTDDPENDTTADELISRTDRATAKEEQAELRAARLERFLKDTATPFNPPAIRYHQQRTVKRLENILSFYRHADTTFRISRSEKYSSSVTGEVAGTGLWAGLEKLNEVVRNDEEATTVTGGFHNAQV